MLRHILLGAVFALPAAAFAEPTIEQARDMAHERLIDAQIEYGLPGISASVAIDGKIVWSSGAGIEDKSTGSPANGQTAHSIASISKPMIAVLVMRLAERGIIDLDASVNDYLAEQKLAAKLGDADEITLRMLLNHTSGLAMHHHFFFEDEDIKRLSHDESIRQFGIAVNPPGEIFEYSNFGYGVAEYVIERQSGKSLSELIEEHIVASADLDNTFLPTRAPQTSNVATRYRNSGAAVPFFDFYHRGAAAIYSSTDDLVRFGISYSQALDGEGELLEQSSAAQMLNQPIELSTFPWDIGLGWQVREVNGHRLVTHAGGMPGTRSRLLIAPEEKVVIAVAMNTDGTVYEDVVSTLTHLFAPQLQEQSAFESLAQAMQGQWSGHADLGEHGDLPLAISISAQGGIEASLAGEPIFVQEIMTGRQGYFHIIFHNGTIPTPLAERFPHRVSLKIRKRGEQLTGYISTENRPQVDRIGSALGYWVELQSHTQD